MPSSATRAWVRTGLDAGRATTVRWREALDRAAREIPETSPLRSVLILPCGEHEIDQIS